MWTNEPLPTMGVLKPRYILRLGSVVLSCAPTPALAWLEIAGAGLIGVAAPGLDDLGRLLALPAVVLLAGLGARDLLLRPTLEADATGLTVAVGLRRVRVGWQDVEGLRVVTDRRAPLLEIDLGDTVVVLPQRRLGLAPYLALEQLEGLRPQP